MDVEELISKGLLLIICITIALLLAVCIIYIPASFETDKQCMKHCWKDSSGTLNCEKITKKDCCNKISSWNIKEEFKDVEK